MLVYLYIFSQNQPYSIIPSESRHVQIACYPFKILSKAHINYYYYQLCGVSRKAHISWLMHSLSCHYESVVSSVFFLFGSVLCVRQWNPVIVQRLTRRVRTWGLCWHSSPSRSCFPLAPLSWTGLLVREAGSTLLWCAWHLVECVNHTLRSIAGDQSAWLISTVSYSPTCTH